MMVGYTFHVRLFHSLLFAGFNRRFLNVPKLSEAFSSDLKGDCFGEFIGQNHFGILANGVEKHCFAGLSRDYLPTGQRHENPLRTT
jgi:hypothetical protein